MKEVILLKNSWQKLINKIEEAIKKNILTNSNIALQYASEWMDTVHSMGDSESDKIFGLEVWAAYKNGTIEKYQKEYPTQNFFIDIPQSVIIWIDEAINNMYKNRK